jgi:hypothetical protein
MSELVQKHDNRATIRWKLLTGVSALALTVSTIGTTRAEDAEHPLIWIELGGQMEHISGQGQRFAPDFLSVYSTSSILQEKTTPLQAQKPPTFSFGEEARILFQPQGSDWVFSAGARIGRSSNHRHVDHQTNRVFDAVNGYGSHYITAVEKFADTQSGHRESHAILDFSAGKDVGFGMFGKDSSSVISFGVRFAQFTSRSTFDVRARPDLGLQYKYLSSSFQEPRPYYHSYHATGHASRSFSGIGPSLSWNGSTPFIGNLHDGELTVDWGANAAVLFGRQKATVRHHESGVYRENSIKYLRHTALPTTSGGHDTVRSVTVPNVGGFAGVSWRVQDFKISFGYRADFFFGAIDGGIDARKSETLGFKGPFASISVGLGD